MDWFRDIPIKRKLTVIILITCSVVLLLACVTLAAYELLDFRRATQRDATVLADILGENIQAALTFDDVEAAGNILKALQAEPNVIGARVFKASGDPFVDYTRSKVQVAFPAKLLSGTSHLDTGHLYLYRPIDLNGKQIGTIYLVMDLQGVYDRLALFSAIAGVVLVGSLVLAFVISSRLQRPISEPILALAKIAKAVAEHRDYSVRAPRQGADELGMLTDAFNHMLAQIARRADELAATNAELEQFAFIASHDLKEPLRMVTQYMGILDRQLGANLTEQQRKFLGFAVEGAQRMQTLISDLLSFTKTSHLQENRIQVDLNQVVAEVLSMLKEQIQQQKAVVTVEQLPAVLGVRTKLALVFQNIIGNALKFHAREVEPRIDISCRKQDGLWVIAIGDNGIGIDPVYHQQIFAVFQRLHGRDEYPGTGMGLAICRKIVEQHHGHLSVTSAEGAGSTFLISLPADDQRSQSEVGIRGDLSQATSKRA